MHEISIRVPAARAEHALDALLALAPRGVHEVGRGEEVELRLRGARDELPTREHVAAAAGPGPIAEREVPDDWEERRLLDYEPVVLAGRLVVRPAWAPPAPGLIDVVLEEGTAFGTGADPATRACLEALLALRPGGAFADVGCGAGVVAIAAAKLGWAPVTALDASPVAVAATRANATANGVDLIVRAADLTAEAPPAADAIAADLPPRGHAGLAERLRGRPAAVLIRGFVRDEVDDVLRGYAARGLAERSRRFAGESAVVVLAPA
jgi:ribosomal protein L11 methyltransferase